MRIYFEMERKEDCKKADDAGGGRRSSSSSGGGGGGGDDDIADDMGEDDTVQRNRIVPDRAELSTMIQTVRDNHKKDPAPQSFWLCTQRAARHMSPACRAGTPRGQHRALRRRAACSASLRLVHILYV